MTAQNKREINVTFFTRDEFAQEWESNISKGGIFVKADPPPGVRERVTVVIEIQEGEKTLALPGEAVHVTPQGVGVQLEPLPKEVTGAIGKILSGEEDAASQEKESNSPRVDQSIYQAIQNMSRHEKAAEARKGNMDARNILIRDRDPHIVMNVLRNPRVSVSEIIQITKSQSLTLDMIKHISKQAEWVAVEDIRLNLILNPKTPVPLAMSLLKRLSDRNVRMLAKRPIKQQIKSAALKIVIDKYGGGARK